MKVKNQTEIILLVWHQPKLNNLILQPNKLFKSILIKIHLQDMIYVIKNKMKFN